MPRSATTVLGLPMNSEKLTDVSCDSLLRRRLGKNARFHSFQERPVNFLGRIQNPRRRIGTVDAPPVVFSCQSIVYPGSLFEVSHVRFQNIMSMRSVAARGFQSDQAIRIRRRDAQIYNQIFDRQAVDAVLDM